MATYNVSEYLEDDGITLDGIPSPKHPDGKAYTFASPSFAVGLWLKNLIEFGQKAALGLDVTDDDPGKLVLDDDDEMDLYSKVMGATLDEMRDDGVSWDRVQKIFVLLLRKWGSGQDVAVTMRESAGEELARPNRATRRAATKAPAKKTAARNSSPKGGSKSSRASSATKAPTAARASTRSSKTSGRRPAAAKAV